MVKLFGFYTYIDFDWNSYTIGVNYDVGFREVIVCLLPLHIIIGKGIGY